MNAADSKPSASADAKKTADPTQTHLVVALKHARPLTAVRFDPQQQYLFTGAEDNTVQRWKLADAQSVAAGAKGADGKPLEVKPTLFEGHDSWVRAIGFSPDGKTLYTGGYDGQVITWDATADKPKPIRKFDAHNNQWVRAIVVSADGKQIATCGNDNLVKLWNAADGKLIREFKGHESHVYNVAFHPDGKSLASCDLKANFKHWEIATGKCVRDFKAEALHKYDTGFRADIGGARALAFSRDGKLLAAGGITNVTNAFAGVGNPAVAEIDWESGKLKVLHVGKEAANGVIWGVEQHADGYWLGIAGSRGKGSNMYFWKPEAAHEFFKFNVPDVGRDMSLAADGVQFAVAHADGNLRIYRMEKKA